VKTIEETVVETSKFLISILPKPSYTVLTIQMFAFVDEINDKL
jgi:hypothetical protein